MKVPSRRARVGVGLAVTGMAALCVGSKRSALLLFSAGIAQIERDWRARHGSFRGDLRQRWQLALDFYRTSHEHPINRRLHVVGIPLIVGGAVALLAAPRIGLGSRVWLAGAASFGAGWLLNLLGHAAYERQAPAFSEDGLSFLAGPVWDLQQLFRSV